MCGGYTLGIDIIVLPTLSHTMKSVFVASLIAESMGVGGISGPRNPLSPTSGRLHKEGTTSVMYMYMCIIHSYSLLLIIVSDMAIYGREPATDRLIFVVCDLCGRVMKSQAVLKHKGV